MPDKYRPKIIGPVRVCKRHAKYVKECPQCNTPVMGEEHLDMARKQRVITPRYRAHFVYQGKTYNKPQAVAETTNKPEQQTKEEAV